MPRVLIGASGSVACVKLPELISKLVKLDNVEVKVILTEHAVHFVEVDQLGAKVYRDEDEWVWKKIGDPILHIELRKWADIFVIAPMDANTLAKVANGLCDNLLTCVARAWDMSKPLLFCPSMNTLMLSHPLTGQQIDILSKFGYEEVPSISKKLACGDEGSGAMAQVQTIVDRILSKFSVNEES